MTKFLLTFASFILGLVCSYGQVSQTISVSQPGSLSTLIGDNKTKVTDLTLTGTINATDFTTIKQMTALKNLDMSQVKIDNNTIPDQAFQNRVLNSLVLPEGLETVGNRSFWGANLGKSLVLPSTLKEIKDLAFWGFKTPIDFSKTKSSLETIGWAFVSQYTESMVLDFSDFTKLKNMGNGIDSGKRAGAFGGYSGHVILPKNLEVLPAHTFAYFKGTVELPSSLRSIDERCFNEATMTGLILPEGLETIGIWCFSSAQLGESLVLPSTLKEIKDLAFWGFKTPIDFSKTKSSLETIGWAFVSQYTESMVLDFSDFTKLKNMGNGIDSGKRAGAFGGYSGHVILPKNLEVLPAHTFAYFKGTVDLPPSLNTLGDYSFRSADMSKLSLPEGLTKIGVEAFRESNIKEGLVLPSTLSVIEDQGFWGVPYFIDFSKTKSSLTSIGWIFVAYCTGFNELDLSEFTNLKTMKTGVWDGVRGGAFTRYPGHVILPKNLEVLPSNTFVYFTGTVDLPSGLKTIGDNAFYLSDIKKIDIPATVTTIGANAFNNCTALDTIISRNGIPPTLGANVFLNVNKQTTQLIVPESAINLYGTAAQWKDFLNVKPTIASELDVRYSDNGVDFVDYHAVRIGEYYWLDQNFHHYAPKTEWSGERGDEINYPMTQARLDKYLPCANLDPADYQVNIDDFNTYYGLHYHWYSASYMQDYGKIYESGQIEEGWGLPTAADAFQLFAMAPSYGEPYVNGASVSFGLGAHLGDNPLAFDIAPKYAGSRFLTYWFGNSTNLTSVEDNLKFKFMPSGKKLNANNDPWENGVNGTHYGNKGDIYHLFYAAGFWLKGHQNAYVHDRLDVESGSFHWNSIRFTRRLTDEELGYKLYKNDAKEDIIKLGLTDVAPEGYTELEPGYLRGYYVKYILDNPNPTMTPADLYYKLKYYTNVYSKDDPYNPDNKQKEKDEAINGSTNTRSVVSIPFRAESSVSVYPNPVTDVLNVSGEGVESVSVYDMSGRQVATANSSSISVSDLNEGMYVVKVKTATGESTHKVMKK